MRTSALLLGLLASVPVAAQDAADARAVRLYEQSVEHYNEGRFEIAAALLREALELQPNEPTLQYNLARALEGQGDLDGAIEAYEALLQHDELDDRGAIEERLETLRRQHQAERELEALRAQRETEPDPIEAEPGPVREPPERSISAAPWTLAAIGVVGVGVGAIFGALAVDKNNAARQEPIHERASALRDDAETRQLVANIAFVAGGVLAGVGLVWGIVDARKSRVDVVATPGGLSLNGRF